MKINASYIPIPNTFNGRIKYITSFCTKGNSKQQNNDISSYPELEYSQLYQDNLQKSAVICCNNQEKLSSVTKLLDHYNLPFKIAQKISDINDKDSKHRLYLSIFHTSKSFMVNDIIFLPSEIILPIIKSGKKKKNNAKDIIMAINELEINRPVIHIDHGIGIFEGSTSKEINGQVYEMLKIRYSNGNIYVPVEKIFTLSSHNTIDPDKVILDSIGSQSWTKLKKSAKQNISILAHQIIDTASKRNIVKAPIYSMEKRIDLIEKLASSFKYVETTDQLNAISDLLSDLESGKPMYRIVCGDVGFGKTEVAIRGMFAVVCGKLIGLNYNQVVMICPTVLLAKQQFESIKSRLESFGINIALLCSKMSPKENRDVIKKIANGEIDIIIGTSSVLSKKIEYNNLGMVIVDEEHLFGVEQKESVIKTDNSIHYLSLSATPIPRTLYKAISGLQDISVISTPPHNRIGTKTQIVYFAKESIKSIIEEEINQNGQTIIITPKINYIPELQHDILNIIGSKANIVIMHGKLTQNEISKSSKDIQDNKCNIIIATTIIASGMDFANSNTIIIHKPHLFGLSQLHQIRGRVGRRDRKGNCYLLVESQDRHKKEQMSRLYYLKNFSDFGSGFNIANLDLEIRGGGNLISKEQSGKIEYISVGLYYELLNKAIEDLKGSQFNKDNSIIKDEDSKGDYDNKPIPEINIDKPIYISDESLPSLSIRLQLYRKISNIRTMKDLDMFYEEMQNRFGNININILNLDNIIELREFCLNNNIAKLNRSEKFISIGFYNKKKIDFSKLIQLTNKPKSDVKILPSDMLSIKIPGTLQNSKKVIPQNGDNSILLIKQILANVLEKIQN